MDETRRQHVRRFVSRYMQGRAMEKADALDMEREDEHEAAPVVVVQERQHVEEPPLPVVEVREQPRLLIDDAAIRRCFRIGNYAAPWLKLLNDGLPDAVNAAGDRDFDEVWRWTVENRPLSGGGLIEWKRTNG